MVETRDEHAASLRIGKEPGHVTVTRSATGAGGIAGRTGRLDSGGFWAYNGHGRAVAARTRGRMASIAGYQIVEKLRESALSELYLVRDVGGELFALKVVAARLSGDKGARKRLMNEGAMGMRLRHSEHVVRTEKVGREGSRNFVVLEYLRGVTLRTLLRQGGALPETELVQIARQAALGLAYIHDQGLVHKDVKPDNIFVTDKAITKIIDFGITESKLSGRLNFFRSIQGSPSYIAPELLRKGRPNELSDLYSFGVTLYEAATGRLPYSASSTQQAMAWTRDLRRVADPPRLHAKELSHQMDTLILKSLEKDPSSRLAGFNEFVTALGRNPRARPSAAGIPVDFIRRHLARGAAGGGGGAGGGAGGAGAAGAR